MRKKRLLICFAVIAMLITGCREKPAVPPQGQQGICGENISRNIRN